MDFRGGRPERKPLLERFWEKVRKTDSCWIWLANKIGGYGQFTITGRIKVQAHRFSYELLKGPIPCGLQIDHLCKNPSCVNPDHLQPVTARENTLRSNSLSALNARKKFCSRGHEFSGDNLVFQGRRRRCRTCRNERCLVRYYKRKAEY